MERESAQIALWKAVKCVGVPTSVRNARKDWWKPMDNVHVLLEGTGLILKVCAKFVMWRVVLPVQSEIPTLV